MGFFRPGEGRYTRLSSCVDWRKLYFDVKLTLQDTSEAGHIRNRHRIWRCLDHLVNSLLPCLAQRPALQDHKTIELELSAEGLVATRLANGPISQNHPKSRGISVSRIEFDGMEYICGIRVFERSQSNLKKETSRVGYIISDSEVHTTVLAQHRVTGIRVACSASGITGLGLQIKGSAGAAWSYVNMTTEPLPQVGVATMEPADGSSLSALIIGLDVCKFVSLQLVEQRSDDSTSSMPNAVSWLWHPREPETRRHGLILPSTPERPQVDSPVFILDMSFGGLEGILLPRLTRIAALHDDRIGCFRGLSFSYVDGSSKIFGMATIVGSAADHWSCIEQSFALDGSGGERIISIEFVPEHCLSKIKIATSRGRVLEFGRIAKTGKTLGVSASSQWHRLAVPTSQAISSILATVEMSSGVIISLGLSYISVSDASAPTSTLSEPLHTEFSGENGHPFTFSNKSEKWDQAPVDLKRSNGCFTSVVLSNARRIGISVGLGGKSRGANHISGLCFEFWGPSEPIYVGQWYCEVGNIQLKQGERLQSFTFWQTQEAPPFSQQENYGKVTDVRICKAGYTREELEVCLGNKEDMLSYSFEENPYEGLTGLAWAFDHKLDHIYVLTEPSIYFPKTSLTLHNMKDFRPSSRTPGKLFWEAQDEGNGFYGLSCVHAIFCQETGDLKGFVFEYGTGHIIKQAGCIDGVAASIPLWEDQRIIRMDVCIGSGMDEVVTPKFRTASTIRGNGGGRLLIVSGVTTVDDGFGTEPTQLGAGITNRVA
ncbi:hypothetical protein NM208_g9858 [Fusarium decemcellulare]|uniref:Uncharacterized protein n=1 Tax=Fusarium decemcellulare TaxID=57161 RepID=A0ACC1S010_9HYPO|nr:hypothetical protein NM208_g9858 [Fusarium decemcellulare]